ncbi:MAG: hypothetical protein ACREU7_04770, partial [Burkholderiales bacterium]
MTPKEFEQFAAARLNERFGVLLSQRRVKVGSVTKSFDLVSHDGKFVGDAKFYKNSAAPSGKLATISEYVFLLEKCSANHKFIVFG